MTTYGCDFCTKCAKKYYVYLGNMSDQTAPDVEAVRCPHCKQVVLLEGVDWIGEDEIEHAFVEDGVKKLA